MQDFDREFWFRRLQETAAEAGFEQGFGLVYGPWISLQKCHTAFISLNPGVAPEGKSTYSVSDERGNTYEAERLTTKSRITAQFLRLCEFLGLAPSEVLCGVAVPFLSPTWKGWSNQQVSIAMKSGRSFWTPVLRQPHITMVVVVSSVACDLVVDILGGRKELEISSGWGTAKLRRYVTPDNKTIVHLPHLSRYTLFSRHSCDAPLREIFTLPPAEV